ncbi:MAG: GyrI-like domain-containing protein [Gammaproteobacteria bacterium]|nr:GyrI-like domain-containing protein [Gammaproteobacteria bacterium]
MQPRIVEHGPFTVLGIVTRIESGRETPELFADIWREFESRRREIETLATEKRYFGVRFATDDANVSDYLAGMRVAADTPIPDRLEIRTLPAGRFAVFECAVADIGDSYRYIFTVWLPGASVDLDPAGPVFEAYPEDRSHEPVCIHVPIRS